MLFGVNMILAQSKWYLLEKNLGSALIKLSSSLSQESRSVKINIFIINLYLQNKDVILSKRGEEVKSDME